MEENLFHMNRSKCLSLQKVQKYYENVKEGGRIVTELDKRLIFLFEQNNENFSEKKGLVIRNLKKK